VNTHDARDLVIDSVTGVELSVPIAGPGARCYAFVIDWFIRAILFTAWYGVAALLYNGHWTLAAPLNPGAKWFAFVVAPAAAIYCLYHIVLELALQGRTPGKRLAGVSILARDGSPAHPSALLIRNVFRLVDSLPVFYGVGLVATLITKQHLRIGDMAAGTVLVYEQTAPTLSINNEIASELLQRWPTLDPTARRQLAQTLITKLDPASELRRQLEQLQ